MKKDEIVSVKIYPGIGVARVGNSPNGYFIGPEAPGIIIGQDNPKFNFKDAQKRIKRQAARFRLYGYNEAGEVVREIHMGQRGVNVEWSVHVANKKASWYVFNNSMDLPSNIAMDAERRNKKVLGKDRNKLIIDPGKQSISGKKADAVTLEAPFEASGFKEQVYLGELRTDEKGRLLFLGGHGRSASPVPSNPIDNFSNNDGWHDDVSDGPVTATVKIGRKTYEAEPAWAVCAPPNYAPGITPIITLWDLIRETNNAPGLKEAMERPDFVNDIYPILKRFSMMQWVAANVDLLAGWKSELDFLDMEYVSLLADNNEKNKKAAAARVALFKLFRNPNYKSYQPDKLPVMLGDGVDYPDNPRSLLALLPSQYEMLRQWSKGNFSNRGWRRKIKAPAIPLENYPLQRQPEVLDRGSLEPLLGGAFHPGIELTWPMRQSRLYSDSFRLKTYDPKQATEEDFGPLLTPEVCMSEAGPLANNTPGDLTRWMGVPWQSDAASCQDVYVPKDFPLPVWWPAILPIDVLPAFNYEQLMNRRLPDAQRSKFFGARRGWDRGVGDVGYHAAGGYTEAMIHMVNDWKDLGFIVERPGPRDARKQDLPKEIYVETERQDLQS